MEILNEEIMGIKEKIDAEISEDYYINLNLNNKKKIIEIYEEIKRLITSFSSIGFDIKYKYNECKDLQDVIDKNKERISELKDKQDIKDSLNQDEKDVLKNSPILPRS